MCDKCKSAIHFKEPCFCGKCEKAAEQRGFEKGYNKALNDNHIIHGEDAKEFIRLTKEAEEAAARRDKHD